MTDPTDRSPRRTSPSGRLPSRMTAAVGTISMTLLAGCTGSDAIIDFGPNGPIPPASIASAGLSGAPQVSAADLGSDVQAVPPYDAQPAPQYGTAAPVETVQRESGFDLPPPGASPATPQAEPIESEDLPPPGRMASVEPALRSSSSRASGANAPAVQAFGDIQFLPLIGVPQEKAELLARSLSESAAAKGLNIRPASEAKAKVRLKGYFSAFNDGTNTTLVYVWDVLDENDQRTRRIQGEETIPGAPSDPWSAIDAASLDAVAAKTMDGAREALAAAV